MRDFLYYSAIGIVMAIILVLFTGCDDVYRYPCQNPDNFYKPECQKPKCLFTQMCPEYLVAPVLEKPSNVQPPAPETAPKP